MKFLDLMKARGKSGKVPTMGKIRRSEEERLRHVSGLCTDCGLNPQTATSTICPDCLSKLSLEEIEQDIQRIRDRILKKTQ